MIHSFTIPHISSHSCFLSVELCVKTHTRALSYGHEPIVLPPTYNITVTGFHFRMFWRIKTGNCHRCCRLLYYLLSEFQQIRRDAKKNILRNTFNRFQQFCLHLAFVSTLSYWQGTNTLACLFHLNDCSSRDTPKASPSTRRSFTREFCGCTTKTKPRYPHERPTSHSS